MVQMSAKSVLADCNGMSIVGIPRRYVADIHFLSLFRFCTRRVGSRNPDTTRNNNKCRSTRIHLFLFLVGADQFAPNVLSGQCHELQSHDRFSPGQPHPSMGTEHSTRKGNALFRKESTTAATTARSKPTPIRPTTTAMMPARKLASASGCPCYRGGCNCCGRLSSAPSHPDKQRKDERREPFSRLRRLRGVLYRPRVPVSVHFGSEGPARNRFTG